MSSVKSLMVSQSPLSYGAMAKYPNSSELRKKFTAFSRFGDEIQLYDESHDGKYIFLPRAVCPVGEEDVRRSGLPVEFGMKTGPRNDEQARLYNEAAELVSEGQSFILQAGTGFGKTWLGIALACMLGRTCLVVCTKDDLVKQWRDRLLQHSDLSLSDIGLIQQDTCNVAGKKVVLASLKSLSIPDRYPVSIRQLFGMVIFDEVHRLGADTFQTVCKMFPAKIRLGLSATPQRIDGKELVFFANIGPIRVVGESVPMTPKVLRYVSDWKCPKVTRTNKKDGSKQVVKLPHTAGRVGHVLKYLFRSESRNLLLLHLIERAYANNRRHVVFSTHTEHLELLETMALKVGVPSKDIGRYYGSMSGKKLDEAQTKPLLFATPNKMGEGTDIPWLDCCTLAGPFANIPQIAGRGLREFEGKPQPVIFDIADRDSSVFLGYENRRDEYYMKLGAKVKEMAKAT